MKDKVQYCVWNPEMTGNPITTSCIGPAEDLIACHDQAVDTAKDLLIEGEIDDVEELIVYKMVPVSKVRLEMIPKTTVVKI